MRAISGVFPRLADGAKAAERLVPLLGKDNVNLLTPDRLGEQPEDVPTTEDMPPVGGALGGVVGGALGVATAFALPGVGQVAAFGAAAAALLGAGAAAIGWKLGDAADRASSTGLPIDELYIYEDALRQGRTVVIAMVDNKEVEESVRDVLDSCGAESLDAARQRWWTGLRDAEAEHYESPNGDSTMDEDTFRNGFEAALSPWARGRTYEESIDFVRTRHPNEYDKRAYRQGYERGQAYLEACEGGLDHAE
jgi:hypothetical protein